jgi:hypothetical protein
MHTAMIFIIGCIPRQNTLAALPEYGNPQRIKTEAIDWKHHHGVHETARIFIYDMPDTTADVGLH